MDDLSGFDGDLVNEATVSANDGCTKRKDVVLLGDFFVPAGWRKHAESSGCKISILKVNGK